MFFKFTKSENKFYNEMINFKTIKIIVTFSKNVNLHKIILGYV